MPKRVKKEGGTYEHKDMAMLMKRVISYYHSIYVKRSLNRNTVDKMERDVNELERLGCEVRLNFRVGRFRHWNIYIATKENTDAKAVKDMTNDELMSFISFLHSYTYTADTLCDRDENAIGEITEELKERGIEVEMGTGPSISFINTATGDLITRR